MAKAAGIQRQSPIVGCWPNTYISRDLLLHDDDNNEKANAPLTPLYGKAFVYDQTSMKEGVKWNVPALIEYFKSPNWGHFPIDCDEETNDPAAACNGKVEEMAFNELPLDAKANAVDVSLIQASWPFADDSSLDEALYFEEKKLLTSVKAYDSDTNHNSNNDGNIMESKWDMVGLRDYINSSDILSVDASSSVVSKSNLAPVKVRSPSRHGAAGDFVLQTKDRRSVHFSEVVDVYPVPMRRELAVSRISKEEEEAQNVGKATESSWTRSSFEEFLQQLEPISSSDDDSNHEKASNTSSLRNDPENKHNNRGKYATAIVDKPHSSSHSAPPDKISRKRMHASFESDSVSGQQPMKKKVKREHSMEGEEGVVVDSKQTMKKLLDEYCSKADSGKYKKNSKSSLSSPQRSAASRPSSTRLPTAHLLHKKTVDGERASSTASHLRHAPSLPTAPHRRALLLREAERERLRRNREKERERERNVNRQSAHQRLPKSISQYEEAMREKRLAEENARRGFFRLQYEMVAGADRPTDHQDSNQFTGHSLQKVVPLVEEANSSRSWLPTERYHTSARRTYEPDKPKIDPFLPVVRVYIDGEDSDGLMTFRLFKNLTVKSFKVARQAGLVEVENERRMFPERPDGDKSCRFKNRSRCVQFTPKEDRSRREPATDQRRLSNWNRRKVARAYDKQIDEDQNVGADADCFLKNVMSVLLHVPHSPYGDVPLSKNDMLRGVQQTMYAKKMKATGFERFLRVTLPLRGRPHHLHEMVPPPPPPPPPAVSELPPDYDDFWSGCPPPPFTQGEHAEFLPPHFANCT